MILTVDCPNVAMLKWCDVMLLQGACGYGVLDKNSYPFWSVAAFSLTNSFSVAGPAKACGQCFEIKCVDIGGPFAVRYPPVILLALL